MSEGSVQPSAAASPDPIGRWQAWRRRSIGLRGLLLYLLSLPLGLAALVALASGELGLLLADIGAIALVWAGAQACRRGLRDELLQPARRFTRASRVPYKLLGGLSVALGTGVAAHLGAGQTMPVALVFAGLALGGYHLAYGLRPVGARTEETPHPDGRLREVLEKAESQILAIELAAANLGQVELQARLRGIADQARNIIELILQRPDDLYRARRFLSVYLEGAERVASRYARTHRVNHAHPLEDSFRRVLVEIERVFQDQHERLARNDLGDLDVQISVLRKQLEQEGLG